MADRPLATDSLPLERPAPGVVLRCSCPLVGVLVADDGRRLVAIRPIAEGTRLFELTGLETGAPTRYSVQLGTSLHLDPDCARDEIDLLQHYFWRYLDHDCEPTTVIQGRVVIAVREIDEGEGVTFDYNTTEYELAEPFQCRCGSARCVGVVRGARHLTPAQRARVVGLLPDYLR